MSHGKSHISMRIDQWCQWLAVVRIRDGQVVYQQTVGNMRGRVMIRMFDRQMFVPSLSPSDKHSRCYLTRGKQLYGASIFS